MPAPESFRGRFLCLSAAAGERFAVHGGGRWDSCSITQYFIALQPIAAPLAEPCNFPGSSPVLTNPLLKTCQQLLKCNRRGNSQNKRGRNINGKPRSEERKPRSEERKPRPEERKPRSAERRGKRQKRKENGRAQDILRPRAFIFIYNKRESLGICVFFSIFAPAIIIRPNRRI